MTSIYKDPLLSIYWMKRYKVKYKKKKLLPPKKVVKIYNKAKLVIVSVINNTIIFFYVIRNLIKNNYKQTQWFIQFFFLSFFRVSWLDGYKTKVLIIFGKQAKLTTETVFIIYTSRLLVVFFCLIIRNGAEWLLMLKFFIFECHARSTL